MQKPQHILAILAVTQLLALPAALAQDATRHQYQLAGAPLEKTLLRIASESGVALAYDPKLLESARSAPVNGNYSATEAITRALEGSGFELVSTGGGRTLTIRRTVAAPSASRPAVQQLMAPVALRAPVAAAAAVAAAPNTEVLARVTVSGTRRPGTNQESDDVQRAPTSSYRVSGEVLEEQNLTTLEDLQQLVPGLVIQSTDPSDTQITIRGVGDGGGQASGDANIGMPSSVAIYVDNVYLPRAGMLSSGLGDIAYAEVLSGAQGTMFGANATGGVLNLQTRAPSFTPEASASVSYGQNGYTRGRAMLSGPLSENWAGRLNLVYTNNDGAVTNVRNNHSLNGVTSSGVRGQLLYKQGEKFNLRLSADLNITNSSPTSVLLSTNTFSGVDSFLKHSTAVGNHVVFGPNVDLDDENNVHTKQGGVSAEANWKFDNGYKLRSVTSYRYFRTDPVYADGLSVAVYNNTGTQVLDRTWSQELRLDSPAGEKFDYALGLTYLGENLNTTAHTRYTNNKLAGVYYDATSYNGLDIIRLGTLHDNMLSPYVQGTLHIAPTWDLVGGVRANYEEKGGQFIRYNKAAFNSGYIKEYYVLPSGTLVLKHELSPEWSSYLAGSYGEKSGGLNISAGAAKAAGYDTLIIKPEKTKSLELGVKGALLDNKVNLKADVFLTEVSDFQTQGYDPDTQQTYLMNAGTFRSRGAEVSVAAAITRNWDATLAGVFNDAYYTDYANARCPAEVTLSPSPPASCNLTGERVFNAPRVTWNASTRYSWRSDNGLKNFVSARYSYRGWMYGTVDNSYLTRVSGYGLAAFAAGTGRKLEHGEWSASVWVNNAFDKQYYRRVVSGDYGSVWGWLGESRTFGATLSYKY
ncbi:TonB-dependent receptor domain-containing protein [Duganella guangzhouensis]|uniref:TonB-dependent receptor domain-containing protein n=1 Tax=Duganella guangzhouensis TaxID=2666084 RepID=UPI0018A1E50F|nr:TonB-dependent receptor [Duganella guangzhouensis]